jgi:DNA-binding SARP family transcriptional activator
MSRGHIVSTRPEIKQPAELIAADLRIYLLGPPRVEWAGRPLVIPRRQARALLYRLAVRVEPAPREHLCFLFWPDVPESTARRNLSHLLTHLRHALPDPDLLLITEDRVGLDPRRVWSDAVAFERLGAAFIPLPPTPSPLSQGWERGEGAKGVRGESEGPQQAVDLYRGPFLAGFSLPNSPEFEAWAAQERYAWERLYLEALAALIEDRRGKEEYEAAIAYAQRYLATDDLAEDVHRRLIELYAAVGDRSAALRQFERCAVILERELGVSPLPETRAVYQAVLDGRPPSQQRPAARPVWTTLPSLDAPLVGRDEALHRLDQVYARARSGHGQVVLISGEPGIGKSRLVQEFVTGLEGKATLVVGGGHETEQALPYWPLVEALRPHLPAIDWAVLDIEPFHLIEVARLLPELRTLLPDLPAPSSVEPGQEQARLLQALAHWLLSLAAHHPPLVLCLDDLHWADTATLSWLGYLARHLKRAPVLVLGSYRTEEAGAVAALRAQVARLGVLQEITLEGLMQADVLYLVRHLSGQSSGAERFSQHLHRETGGNPFFLLETLRAMFEAGILWEDETGWTTSVDETTEDYRELPLPETVCQAIRDRLSRLSPQAYQVLEAGAVIGHQFDFELVWATSGRHESEVMDALDTLLARQLIAEDDGGYRFNHDLIRAVAYRDLSYGRRWLLHRRAGEALEKLRPDDVATLARHFERAGEPDKAVRYTLQAGQAARAVFAYAEARAYFDRALTFLEQELARLQEPEAMAANLRLRVQALDGRGWAFRLLGDMEAYVRDSQEVARLAGLLGDQRTLAHLRWREAYTHRWFCRYAEALEAAEDGLHLSQAAADRLLEAMCWREVGMAARATGDYDRAWAALEGALHLFAGLGETVYEIHTLGNLSTLCWYEGEYEKAMDLARRALARCDGAGLPLERRLPLGDMGVAAAALGDGDLARRCLSESLAIARQIADRTQEILCLGHLGWLCVGLEQPAEALEHLGAALALAERIGSCTEQSWLHAGLAEAHRLAGDAETAVAHAHRAVELARASGRAYDQELARRVLAGLASTDWRIVL